MHMQHIHWKCFAQRRRDDSNFMDVQKKRKWVFRVHHNGPYNKQAKIGSKSQTETTATTDELSGLRLSGSIS